MLKYTIDGGNLPVVICYPELRQNLPILRTAQALTPYLNLGNNKD